MEYDQQEANRRFNALGDLITSLEELVAKGIQDDEVLMVRQMHLVGLVQSFSLETLTYGKFLETKYVQPYAPLMLKIIRMKQSLDDMQVVLMKGLGELRPDLVSKLQMGPHGPNCKCKPEEAKKPEQVWN